MDPHFIGVDVGTGSVRAGLFSSFGSLLHVATREIQLHNPEPGYYQQSSEEIWNAVCETVQEIVTMEPVHVGGISFCGTCSLVAIGSKDEPISICKSGDPKWNVLMWMDHRAEKETLQINGTKHSVLSNVGGSISPEMQTPKILWLRNNLKESFRESKHYFDLSDFLRWRATGSEKRSICSLVCKWTFVNEPCGKCTWEKTYFEEIGLAESLDKFGNSVSFPGDSDLISKDAAAQLGLNCGTKVGFSMVDAHSGVLGMIACKSDAIQRKLETGSAPGSSDIIMDKLLTSRLALICGTSNCVMALSKKSISVPGVWGPYYGVILEDFYLAEGGQSVSGKLVDHIVSSHLAYGSLLAELGTHSAVLSHLEELLTKLANVDHELSCLTKNLHIWPDFHGNRSPFADPTLKGTITGLSLAVSKEDLAILYLATLQSIAYGTRHIKETLEHSGYEINEIVMCGGLAKSKLFRQLVSDAIGIDVLEPTCTESVLLGSAIAAAAAYYCHNSGDARSVLMEILSKMSGKCTRISPNQITKRYHDKKYKVFLRMLDDQLSYREMMGN